jgi:hypothetical protein
MVESKFFERIAAKGNLWVAMQELDALCFEGEDNKVGLPVWYSKKDFDVFLANTKFADRVRPVEVPIEGFKSAWLQNPKIKFDELIINPKGYGSEALVFTKSEFESRLLC